MEKKINPKSFIQRFKETAYGYSGKAYGDPYVKTKQKQNKVASGTPEVQCIEAWWDVASSLFFWRTQVSSSLNQVKTNNNGSIHLVAAENCILLESVPSRWLFSLSTQKAVVLKS